MTGKPRAAIQEGQLNHERNAGDDSPEFFNQIYNRASCPARRKQIIGDQHSMSGANRVLVNLECVRAVFQVIGY